MHKLDFTTDALLVSNFYNILYLSGFKGLSAEEREAWLLITKNNAYFFTDGRYEEQAKSLSFWQALSLSKGASRISSTALIISHEKKLTDYLKEIIEQESLKTIGFESEDLKYKEYEQFTEKLSVKFVPTSNLILGLRAVKSGAEIQTIQKACALAYQCLKDIVKTISVGQTEAEIAFKLEFWIKKKGADLAFYPIVAVDTNSAQAHYDTKTQGKTKVKKGSVILIDFGITYKNYRSDMTRMVFFGKPTNEVSKTYDTLLKAQEAGIAALKKTQKSSEIDTACRKLLKSLKFPNYAHSTGHGVGLEIHENPKLSPVSTDTLQKGHVFTVEPGVYFGGKYGMRIEDTIVLAADKKPVVLTNFPKRMLII